MTGQGIRNGVLFRKITFDSITAHRKINVALAMTIISTAMRLAQRYSAQPRKHKLVGFYYLFFNFGRLCVISVFGVSIVNIGANFGSEPRVQYNLFL